MSEEKKSFYRNYYQERKKNFVKAEVNRDVYQTLKVLAVTRKQTISECIEYLLTLVPKTAEVKVNG